jgi:hypothetical protein
LWLDKSLDVFEQPAQTGRQFVHDAALSSCHDRAAFRARSRSIETKNPGH